MGMVHWHNQEYKPLENGRKVWKGETQVIQAPTPTPAPSTAEAINAYIAGMPAMYGAQMEWAPKLAEQQMGLTQQYLPQATALAQQLQAQYGPQQAAQEWAMQQQYGPLYAAQQQELQRQYEPEAYAAKQALGGITGGEYMATAPYLEAGAPALGTLGGIYTPEYLGGYSAQQAPGMEAARERLRQSARGAWASRGLAESGMSAEDETKMLSEFELPYAMQQEQMTQQTLQARQAAALGLAGTQMGAQESAYDRYLQELGRRQNVGLSLAGRYNVPTQANVTTPQVTIPQYQAPDITSGYNLGNIMNYMQQGYGTYQAAAKPLGYTQGGGGGLFGMFG